MPGFVAQLKGVTLKYVREDDGTVQPVVQLRLVSAGGNPQELSQHLGDMTEERVQVTITLEQGRLDG